MAQQEWSYSMWETRVLYMLRKATGGVDPSWLARHLPRLRRRYDFGDSPEAVGADLAEMWRIVQETGGFNEERRLW